VVGRWVVGDLDDGLDVGRRVGLDVGRRVGLDVVGPSGVGRGESVRSRVGYWVGSSVVGRTLLRCMESERTK
jgi:hypothetical protein